MVYGMLKRGVHGVLIILALLQASLLALEGSISGSEDADSGSSYALLEGLTSLVYRGIDQSYFLVVPILNTGIGSFMGGKYGALLGFVFGLSDELLTYLGAEDNYYLTAAFLGAGSLDKLDLPYHANHVVGAAAGLSIASGELDALKDYAGNPVQGALNGLVYGGTQGAVLGGLGGVLDEALKAKGLTHQDWVSPLVLSLAQAKALGTAAGIIAYLPKAGEVYTNFRDSYPLPGGTTEAFAVILAAIKIYNERDSGVEAEEEGEELAAHAKTPFEIIDAFNESLSEIIGKERLDSMMQRQAIVMVAMPLLGSQLSMKLHEYFQIFDTELAGFKKYEPGSEKAFFNAVSLLTVFIVPYVGEFFLANLLSDYQGRALAVAVQDALHERLAGGEMPLKLARHEEASALIDAMDANIYSIATDGEHLLSQIAQSQVKGVYSICTLHKTNSLDFAVLVQFFNDLFVSAGVALGEMENAVEEKMLPLKSKLSTLQKHWHTDSRNLVYGEKQALLSAKEQEIKKELRRLSEEQAFLMVLRMGFFSTKGILVDFIFNYSFVALKMVGGEGIADADRLPFDDYSKVLSSSRELSGAYGWYADSAGRLIKFNQAKANVGKLIGFMNEGDDSSIAYAFEEGDANALKLEDFSVGYDGDGRVTLLQPQTLNIPQGVYVVSGPSGSGKTSFLSKIQGIKHNGIWGEGRVTYVGPHGSDIDIHQATQVDYLVPDTTLFELITSQSAYAGVDANLEERIRELLLEIEIDDKGERGLVSQLHTQKEDWGTILSGGQKRKLAIASAILKTPDVLILDEVFNGLDPESVKKAQSMLKSYLPNTLMLIVDHNYELNNYNGFYDGQLHLENKEIQFSHF